MNVGSLQDKFVRVFALMEMYSLDVLCLQETRVSTDALAGLRKTAAAAGFSFVNSEELRDVDGRVVRGVAFLSRWPVRPRQAPREVFRHHTVWLSVHRPGRRPLVAGGAYFAPSYAYTREPICTELQTWIHEEGEDLAMLGDFNLQPDQEPVAQLLANGTLREMNEAASEPIRGTRASGRNIDYGMWHGNVNIMGRLEAAGLADHKLIMYDVALEGELEPRFVWPTRCTLDQESVPSAVQETFAEHWEPCATHFANLLAEGAVDAAWSMLSGAAEAVLSKGGRASGKPRAEPTRPHQQQQTSTKTERLQSLSERQLRRLQRRFLEWRRNPGRDLAFRVDDEVEVLRCNGPPWAVRRTCRPQRE